MHARNESSGPRPPSRTMLRLFDLYLARFLPRHFHALRVVHGERLRAAGRPLIVCLNHPSWWDPLVCLRMGRALAPAAEHYAPVDARALERYGILRGLGAFPVEQGSLRGARQFLGSAAAVLRRSNSVLWLTPQGSFADARVRPVRFRRGLEALLGRVESPTVLPLALEYVFWNERLPEALALWGEPVFAEEGCGAGEKVERALECAQDELAALAMRRSEEAFASVFAAAQGTGGVYGLWQSLRSAMRGEGLHPQHGSLLSPAPAERERPR